jgi:catechol 2,3-dioxygenase-like lactoylglutathione lyase family enzyme
MAEGFGLSAAVMFVRNLDRSSTFYREVLGLEVVDRSPTAALLSNAAGAQLIVRALGEGGAHPLGGLGVQYVVWAAGSKDDLDRCEQALRQRSAFRERRANDDALVVEGRDPDDLVLMVMFAQGDTARLRELPARIYAW